ncbi:MAG TPA: universal stress protein [Candidatus Acidoferrales bacterium]|nr:universal stress protein [Candidatus Acidoferrales bacterium]
MMPPKTILSPIDFSNHSDDALKVAADLASRLGSELCLVHVVPMLPRLPSASTIFHEAEYEQELHNDAEQRLSQMALTLTQGGLAVKTAVGTANDVGMEILRVAEQNHTDLIVIATHGMTGWHKLAFGSVTEKVVRMAECPVLVLKAQAERESHESSAKADSVAASH